MLHSVLDTFKKHLKNLPGWSTDRKIIVIQSDDWGSIRMQSRAQYENLLKKGIRVDRSIYDRFDTLENRDDLELLFNTLIKYTDKKKNHPVFTFNTVMGNPAFDRIEEDKFEKYYYDDFLKSYKVYKRGIFFDLWLNAIECRLIEPQFHAREHLNVSLWMEALQKNQRDTKIAFDNKFFGLKTDTPSNVQENYLAAFWAESKNDFEHKVNILKDGLRIFKEKFGYCSKSFVACNYIYPQEMERILAGLNVKFIQTQSGHLSPDILKGTNKIKRHFTGQANDYNQIYLVRNCFFEPSLTIEKDPVESCMNEIEIAFRYKKPAIISSHRINYVSSLSIKNRDKSLKSLNRLLTKILKKWPEVEFLSTTKLGSIINTKR